jgi:hypothetical protein
LGCRARDDDDDDDNNNNNKCSYTIYCLNTKVLFTQFFEVIIHKCVVFQTSTTKIVIEVKFWTCRTRILTGWQTILVAASRCLIRVLGANITTVSCRILNCVSDHDHILASLKPYAIKLLISVAPTQKIIRRSKYLHFLNIFINPYNRHSSVQI